MTNVRRWNFIILRLQDACIYFAGFNVNIFTLHCEKKEKLIETNW